MGGRRALPLRARRAARRRRDRAASRRAWTRRSRRSRAASGGGSRSRRTLLDNPELLLLDEPTNHLDVEGVDWLAHHLAARRGTLLVVTHDRWFLDAVCTATWEVADGGVHQYEGGYAAYVLARAERERVAAVREERRQGLLRKELAWLRRGPPARTSKPRFRIEAAEALIADEPEPRDQRRAAALRELAARRPRARRRRRLRRLRRRAGAARRDVAARARATASALVGVNGSGKTTLIRLLAGELAPGRGRGRARRDGQGRPALAGHGRDPGPPARARVARGGAGPRDAQRRLARSPPGCSPTASASAARRGARSCATSRAASAAGCSSCGC